MAASDTYPRLFGNYALIAPLAQGGMGELHLALSGRGGLRKLCVIKLILSHLTDKDFVQRFVDETKLMVKLSHGNIVPVFEAGEIDGRYYLVMEYIEGKDLRALWRRIQETNTRCPLDITAYIVREACRGLNYAHTYSNLHLVHRDISPPNILVSYSGEVRITDFGLAASSIKLQKTAPGVLFGKLSYMAPEHARNEEVDARADIFSLGVIFWELVTGKRLFPPEGTQLNQLMRAANPTFQLPSTIVEGIPPEVDAIALNALAVDRNARYPDAESMRQAIAAFLAKYAPTTDSAALQRFLQKLYGPVLYEEQLAREKLVSEMSPLVDRLVAARQNHSIQTSRSTEHVVTEKHRVPLPTPDIGRGDTNAILADSEFNEPPRNVGELFPELAKGTLLDGRYRIERSLGAGGMGTVFLATHVEIGKQVAVKVLHPSYSQMPDVVSRFRREARSASMIGHPNIVDVFDFGTTQHGDVYFVMEHLTGLDVADTLAAEGPFTESRAIHIGLQVCQALAAAHEAGIIHRDLKPENVFLTSRDGDTDFVKVLDFGVAQGIRLEESRLTNPGVAMGTPTYMAPEQAAGKGCDERTDIYAVGTLLYEMLVGKAPHTAASVIETFHLKANQPVAPLRETRADVSPELERIILSTLEIDPDRRPKSIKHLAYDLRKLSGGRAQAVASLLGLPEVSNTTTTQSLSLPTIPPHDHRVGANPVSLAQARPISSSSRPRSIAIPVTLGAIALMGLAVFAYFKFSSRTPSDRSMASTQTQRNVAPSVSTTRSVQTRLTPTSLPATSQPSMASPSDTPTSQISVSTQQTTPLIAKKKTSETQIIDEAQKQLGAGKFGRARKTFQEARAAKTTDAKALLGLAEVEFQLGNYDAAKAYAVVAVNEGGGTRAHLILGNIHFKLKEYQNAIQRYEQVLKLDATNLEAQRNLHAAREKLNQVH